MLSYIDLLNDDIILTILDSICDDIEKEIEKIENDCEEAEAEYLTLEGDILMESEWNSHFNNEEEEEEEEEDVNYELENQRFQDEIYLNNLSSNIFY
jgi:hypothetical protein